MKPRLATERRSATDRAGAVLVVVVLMSLALFAMAHGLLLSARSAWGAARLGARLVETQARADGAVESARLEGVGPAADTMSIGDTVSRVDTIADGDRVKTTWRRLDREAWLLSAVVNRERRPAVRSERLVWSFEPIERLLEVPGAVAVGPLATVSMEGGVDVPSVADERSSADPASTMLCDGWWEAWVDRAGDTPADALSVVDRPGLGMLTMEDLLAAADTITAAFGTPAPHEVWGRCDEVAPWSWGDPDRPSGPCGAHFALRGAPSSLTVVGGVGQGVLVVDGDLELSAAARFYGVVVVSGRLVVSGGSRLVGAAVAYEGVTVSDDATVTRSVCRAAIALASVRGRLAAARPLHAAARFGPR